MATGIWPICTIGSFGVDVPDLPLAFSRLRAKGALEERPYVNLHPYPLGTQPATSPGSKA